MNTLYIAFALGVFCGFLIGDRKARIKFFDWVGNLLKKSAATRKEKEDVTEKRSRFEK